MQKGVFFIIIWALGQVFGIVSDAYSQQVSLGFYHEEWTFEDGLPVNTITDVEFTDDGYVWISTHDGLIRYEGLVKSGPVPYTEYNISNTEAFKANRLLDLLKGPNNDLFVVTGKVRGMEILVRYKDQSFEFYGSDDGFEQEFNSFDFDNKGRLWVVNYGKLYVLDEGEWLPKYHHLDLSRFSRNTEMEVLSEDYIWIHSRPNNRLIRIVKGELFPIIIPALRNPERIEAYFRDREGNQWLGTSEGLYTIKKEEPLMQNKIDIEVPLDAIQRIFADPSDPERIIYSVNEDYYVFYRGEFQKVDRTIRSGEFVNSEDIIGPKNSGWLVLGNQIFFNNRLAYQSADNIRGSTIDNSGTIWFVTRGALNQLQKSIFKSFNKENSDVENVYPIYEDSKGKFWVSAISQGVFKFDGENFVRFDNRFQTSINRTFSFHEGKNDTMFFGSTKGLMAWDGKNTIEEIKQENGESLGPIRAIYEDQKNRVWAAGRDFIYQKKSGVWRSLNSTYQREGVVVRFIYEDREGTIWFGGRDQGLFYFDESTQTVKSFEYNHLLVGQSISTMYQDEEGVFWVGTMGLGLNRVEFNSKKSNVPKVTYYDRETGLHGLTLHEILEDENNRFWISSNSGIFQVTKQSLNEYASGEIQRINSTVYDESDGLPGIEANGGMQSTAIKDKDGRFWFAMIKGIAIIDPEIVSDIDRNVFVQIEKLSTSDSAYVVFQDQLELNKTERNLHFEFVGYNTDVKPKNIRFRHKLEGYEDTWNEIGNSYDAYYTGVGAGEYTFKVEAAVFGGEWESAGSSMTISIEPYYYETVWFKFLMIISGIMLVIGVIQWRLYQVKQREKLLQQKVNEQTDQLAKQAEKLKELDVAKSKFFTNVSHELRTPLTLIMGPLKDLKRQYLNSNNDNGEKKEKLDLALRHSNRLLRLVNQILDISKLESNSMKMHLSNTRMNVFLKAIVREFAGLAERQNIELLFQNPKQDSSLYVDLDMMEKIFVNLISNAFKFTPLGGKIEIRMEEAEIYTEITVSDNGEGINDEDINYIFDRFYHNSDSNVTRKTGAGIGLALVKELVELHKGEIKVESEPGYGTTFTIRLKKGKNHLEEYFPVHEIENMDQADFQDSVLEPFQTIPLDKEEDDSEEEIDLKTVLIIDDNSEIRNYLKEHLKDKYRIVEAENGSEGLKLAQGELPDIVICDVMMPKMDGFEVCTELKSNVETDFIPVILLTAKAEREDKLEGLEFGADDYILKPFDIDELMLRMKNLIASRKILMEKYTSKHYQLEVSNIEVQSEDQLFLDNLKSAIEEHLADEDFGVEELAEKMSINRVTLHNKLKKLIDKSPSEVIKEFRLEQAQQLLQKDAGNISEVAYSVGFKSISHFSRAFKKRYNITPNKFKVNATK